MAVVSVFESGQCGEFEYIPKLGFKRCFACAKVMYRPHTVHITTTVDHRYLDFGYLQ